MLLGNVDNVSHQEITGWAADDAAPDAVIDVSVFVADIKVAQVACDMLREDLADSQRFGEGRHGFRFRFATPLPDRRDHRIGIRFTSTGRPLPRGEVRLTDNGLTVLPIQPADAAARDVVLPAPVDARSLLDLFGLYEERYGFYQLLSRVALEDVPLRQLRYSVFGRFSPIEKRDSAQVEYTARDHLHEWLRSPEFQRDILRTVMHAYPEKRRLLFVHIPKCAGSDLSMNLIPRFPSLSQQITETVWTTKPALYAALRDLVRQLPFFDCMFMRGHINLRSYIEWDVIRPQDNIFTILRDPVDIAVSQVNYVMTRIQSDHTSGKIAPDTRTWFDLLGIEKMPETIDDAFVQDVCHRSLFHQQIVRPNSVCHWLGGGTASEVAERLRTYGVEVTETNRYNDWLREEWQIDSQTRQNESIKFMTRDSLSPQESEYIAEMSREDLRLHAAVLASLEARAANSVVGEAIELPA